MAINKPSLKKLMEYPGRLGLIKLALHNKRLLAVMAATAMLPLTFFSVVILLILDNQWVFELSGSILFLILTAGSALFIGLALTPSIIAASLCGYFLGWAGLLAILISYPVAAVIGLLAGRFIISFTGISPFREMQEYSKYLIALSNREMILVIYSRLSPVMPFAMMNVFLATLPLHWSKYIAGSLIGMLPRTLIFFWTGMNADEIWAFIRSPGLEGIWQLIPFILIFISLAGFVHIFKSTLSEATFHDNGEKQGSKTGSGLHF